MPSQLIPIQIQRIIIFIVVMKQAERNLRNAQTVQLPNRSPSYESSPNHVLLTPPPQIVLKHTPPTNYQTKGKWFIDTSAIPKAMDDIIKQVEKYIEEEEEAHFHKIKMKLSQKKADSEKEQDVAKKIEIMKMLRKANELNKIEKDPVACLYISMGLGFLYREIGLRKMTIYSYESAQRMLTEAIRSNKFQEITPHSYFAENKQFYKRMAERYWAHYMRGRAHLYLSSNFTADINHFNAYLAAKKSYIDFLKATYEIFIITMGKFIEFSVRNTYRLRARARGNMPNLKKQSPHLKVEFQNYQFCINTLDGLCQSKAFKISQMEELRRVATDLKKTITNYCEYSFSEGIEEKELFLPVKMDRMRFLDVAIPQKMDRFFMYDCKGWGDVNVEMEDIYELVLYTSCALYGMSVEGAECLRNLHQIDQIPPQVTKEINKINPNDALEAAYLLSEKYLSKTSLFLQIRNRFEAVVKQPLHHDRELTENSSGDCEQDSSFELEKKLLQYYPKLEESLEEKEEKMKKLREIVEIKEKLPSKQNPNQSPKQISKHSPQNPMKLPQPQLKIHQRTFYPAEKKSKMVKTPSGKAIYKHWNFSLDLESKKDSQRVRQKIDNIFSLLSQKKNRYNISNPESPCKDSLLNPEGESKRYRRVYLSSIDDGPKNDKNQNGMKQSENKTIDLHSGTHSREYSRKNKLRKLGNVIY